MKLHLPAVLLVMAVSSVNYAVAETCSDIVDGNGALVTSIVKEYGNGATGSGYGVSNRENGAPIQSSVITVKDGADMDTVLGGIHIASGADGNNNHHNDQPLIDAGTNTPSIKDGVTINVEGGKVGQILGGNSISSGGEAAVAVLGEKVNVGSITINVTGGEIGMVDTPGEEAIMGGGGRWCGTVDNGGIEVNISGGLIHNTVYAGTNGGSTGYTKLNISGGTINADVYGAGRKDFGVVLGNTEVNVSGGTINGNVYAAGDQDTVKGNTKVTVSGQAKIMGVISGNGTNNAIVEGTSVLNIDGYAGETALKVQGMDAVNVMNDSQVTISSLATSGSVMTISVDDSSSLELQLEEVTIYGANSAIKLNTTALDSLNVAQYTIVLTADMLTSPHEQEFVLMAGDFMSIWTAMPNKEQIRFVLEDGSEYEVADFSVQLELFQDIPLPNITTEDAGIVVRATIPEPTTATLSLLALTALAARRRRK